MNICETVCPTYDRKGEHGAEREDGRAHVHEGRHLGTGTFYSLPCSLVWRIVNGVDHVKTIFFQTIYI